MKETLEKNRLIAEFMGLKFKENGYPSPYWLDGSRKINNLLFHSSWDWLIPAVEKIESLGLSTKIYTGHTTIASRDGSFISQKLNDSKIKATYQAVFEFINWYTLSQGEKQL